MTLEQILENREPGTTQRAHNWYSYCWHDPSTDFIMVNVVHHWTMMLQFRIRHKKPYLPLTMRFVQHVDIGHGSKSDQKGMNRIFIKLGLPLYYARNNRNPRIVRLPKDSHDLPVYLQNREVRVNVFGYAA